MQAVRVTAVRRQDIKCRRLEVDTEGDDLRAGLSVSAAQGSASRRTGRAAGPHRGRGREALRGEERDRAERSHAVSCAVVQGRTETGLRKEEASSRTQGARARLRGCERGRRVAGKLRDAGRNSSTHSLPEKVAMRCLLSARMNENTHGVAQTAARTELGLHQVQEGLALRPAERSRDRESSERSKREGLRPRTEKRDAELSTGTDSAPSCSPVTTNEEPEALPT